MDKINKEKVPAVAVDVIIEIDNKILIIKRKYPPLGYALVGGFVNYGEALEEAAIREVKEETGLDVELTCQLHTYSAPDRDPRKHVISTVFIGKAKTSQNFNNFITNDEVEQIKLISLEDLESGNFPQMVFDHEKILKDYLLYKKKQTKWL